MMRKNVLAVIQETKILGKKIKMYGSIENIQPNIELLQKGVVKWNI